MVGGVLGGVDAFLGMSHRTMHPPLLTLIRKHQRPQPITLHRLQLITLAPIDIRPARFARTVDDMRRLNLVKRLPHGFLLVHARGRAVDVFALLPEKVDEETADPAVGAPDEETVVGGGWGGGGHGG